MRNFLYNFFLLIFAAIQCVVAIAIIALIAQYGLNSQLTSCIVLGIGLIILAVIDKFLRGISGFMPIILCIICSPIRVLAQFVILILTIVSLAKTGYPISERGEYDDDFFISTLAYVALGIDYKSNRMKEKTAERRAAIQVIEDERNRKKAKRKELLARDPNYFLLEQNLCVQDPYISSNYVKYSAAGRLSITYNDDYTIMNIKYNAKLAPDVYMESEEAFAKKNKQIYYDECKRERVRIQGLVEKQIKDYIMRYRFKGRIDCEVSIQIEYSL